MQTFPTSRIPRKLQEIQRIRALERFFLSPVEKQAVKGAHWIATESVGRKITCKRQQKMSLKCVFMCVCTYLPVPAHDVMI